MYETDIDYRFTLKKFSQPCLPLYRSSNDIYQKVKRLYKAKWPTIGLISLVYLMSLDFNELHITGVSFFRTPYQDGYPTVSNDVNQILKFNNQAGFHDILSEVYIFKAFYDAEILKNKSIFLDDCLASILNTL